MTREATAREAFTTESTRLGVPAVSAASQRVDTPIHLDISVPRAQWPGKRVFDIVGALVLALVFAPVILVIVVWLGRQGGPIIFGHRRVGRSGKIFTCYKFRTMVPNAEEVLGDLLRRRPDLRAEWARDHKLREDPRVTPFGAFLRRTSLDELPQLWNVLKGDMSLVGPRPIVKQEIAKYGRAIRHYLAVRPGLTGLWQVSGRNNVEYRRRVAMDRIYATRTSLRLDLWILLQTVGVVLFRRGAY